jgi:hypothetical protein
MTGTYVMAGRSRIRALRIRRLNGQLMASLLFNEEHEDVRIAVRDALVTAPEVVDEETAERLIAVWRESCVADGYREVETLP